MPTSWLTANRCLNVFAVILKQLSVGLKKKKKRYYMFTRSGICKHSK